MNDQINESKLEKVMQEIAETDSNDAVLQTSEDESAMQRTQSSKKYAMQISKEDMQRWIETEPIENLSLAEGEQHICWIWKGYIAKGLKTEISAFWKAGKTTLLIQLILSILAGTPFAGMETIKVGIYIVSEEARVHWIERREKHNLNGFAVKSKPFSRKPSRVEWECYLEELANYCLLNNYGLVVFDTISDFWPISDENDPIQVKDAVRPMNYLTEKGIGVLIFHHFSRKGPREGGGGRGSGALPADVDVSIDFCRYDGENDEDTRRILKGGNSRFAETPRQTVIQLTSDGYISLGTQAQVAKEESLEDILHLLPIFPETTTIKAIIEDWPEQTKAPNKSTLSRALNDLEKVGKARRQLGAGNKADLWSCVAETSEDIATQEQNQIDSIALQPQPYSDATNSSNEEMKLESPKGGE